MLEVGGKLPGLSLPWLETRPSGLVSVRNHNKLS